MSKGLFDQLNLTTQERRLVVIGGAVLFLVLNLWFIWPHFDELSTVRAQLQQTELTLQRYQNEIAQQPEYEKRRTELKELGAQVLEEDPSTTFSSYIITQAKRSGVRQTNLKEIKRTATDDESEFFEEKVMSININSASPEDLVDFLMAIASSDLAIRVRELDLQRDRTGTKLSASKVELVASFQKANKTETEPAATRPRRSATPSAP
jgi:Tfp pilus assembly protein PilO